MADNNIKRLFVFGAVVIMSIIAVQSYWFYKTWDIQEKGFDQSVRISLRKVAEGVASVDSFQVPTIDLIKQVSSNYYVVNINNSIDAGLLEYYLKKELETSGLTQDFEYGIFDCSSKEMVYGDYCNIADPHDVGKAPSELPIYDEFIYYFGVKFPNRTSFLLGGMPLSIILTLTLFLTVLFFGYSMYIILRQKRLTEMQKDFINNMTHEFKTPISTINISADVFLNNETIKGDPRLSKYASIIKEQNTRLNHQVEKVLQLAQLEKEHFQLKIEAFDLTEKLNNVLKSTEINIQKKKGILEKAIPSVPIWIKADQLHFTNILHNLIDNATKYCKEKPFIRIGLAQNGDTVKLEIKDQGIGIPKEHQQRVFDKFYRVPTGNVHNVKGFGLGLFYVKNICNTHGWKLKLKSNEEEGTIITIVIPTINKPD